MEQAVYYNVWLNRFAKLVAVSTFILIFIGGLVTSTGSGLAVPDWPTTYGQFMFSFPLSKMVGGILYEHGHRMVASIVGMLTVILTIWIWLIEPRKWLKWFAGMALFAVILQGILGGITVIHQLPTLVSVMHGCLAQAFFMMTIALAVFTSKKWLEDGFKPESLQTSLFTLAAATTGVVYMQLILGAIMRHTGAGLAIPDFPLAFGKLIPAIQTQAIAVHFLHRLGAIIVSIFIFVTFTKIITKYRSNHGLVRIVATLVVALIAQITLAALTIWSQKAVLPTTAHVATGAFILGTSLVLALRSLFAPEQDAVNNLVVEHATAA